MANEAVIVELLGNPKGQPVSFLCDDGVGIEKGTILWFTDNRKVSGASASPGQPFAGIAATEKVANDGSTHIGCYTCGIFDCYAQSAVTNGAYCKLSGLNMIATPTAAEIDSGFAMGKVLETVTAADTVQVAVGIY